MMSWFQGLLSISSVRRYIQAFTDNEAGWYKLTLIESRVESVRLHSLTPVLTVSGYTH